MDSRDFLQEQQRAIERMREMSRRSTADTAHTMPPAPAFVKVNGKNPISDNMQENAYSSNDKPSEKQNPDISAQPQKPSQKHAQNASFPLFDLPFLDKLQSEPDTALLLGLLLLLWSEKADKRLLLALLYIVF